MKTTTTINEAQLQALIDQALLRHMVDFLLKQKEASRARNGYNCNGMFSEEIDKVEKVIGDRVGSQPKVLDESQDKTTGIDEGTGTKLGVPDDDDDEDDVKSDANDDKEASDSEKTDSDKDENLNINQNDDEEEEKEKEDIRTPNSFEFNHDEEEYDELYKDVDVKSLVAQSKKERKGDAEMTDADESASQEKSCEQVIEDSHVTLTSSSKSEGSKKSSFVSSDFASKFLNLDNASPVIDEVASMMNVKTPHVESSTLVLLLLTVPVTAILETSTVAAMNVSPIIKPFSSISQMSTPTPVATTEPTTSLIPTLPDFASYLDSTKECLPWNKNFLKSNKLIILHWKRISEKRTKN
ncbi:hypothetical protein Tco_1394917 [Tanacetum coccineum]